MHKNNEVINSSEQFSDGKTLVYVNFKTFYSTLGDYHSYVSF